MISEKINITQPQNNTQVKVIIPNGKHKFMKLLIKHK
jgi:hypothetical protein